jgi:uncharacterized protein YjbJ (UPF0337 family)
MEDKAKGRMKEDAGAFTGDEDKKAEGRAQQRKGAAREEATQKERTRQEQAKHNGSCPSLRCRPAHGSSMCCTEQRLESLARCLSPIRTLSLETASGPKQFRDFSYVLCSAGRNNRRRGRVVK